MKKLMILLSGMALSLSLAAQLSQNEEITVHDPVMIQEDSVYYLFCTGKGIGRYRSLDMKNWEALPGVFDQAPAWVMEKLPEFRNHIWAPDIAYVNGRYLLYYSVSRFGKNSSCIGMVSSPSLHPEKARWTDHGPVICSEPGKDDWNAIDPNFIQDESGKAWLSFGSFWGGIQLFPLDDRFAGIHPGEGVKTIAARSRTQPGNLAEPGDGAIEAPFIVQKGEWYYLFVSWDYCCRGEKSTYHVRVGRAQKVDGPYLDREGKALSEGGGEHVFSGTGKWAAAGHNAVFSTGGADYFICHAYDREDEGRPKLVVLPLKWDDEMWPIIQ